jgi:phosphoglycolate phosphatase
LLEQALKAVGDHELVHIEQAVEIYARVFKEGCMYQVKPYEGILELLVALKEKGLRLAVLSNKPHEQTNKIVASFFEAGTFDLVEGLKPNVPRKPDPTAAVLIAEQLGFTKEACIYIGDSDTDMMTGNNAGMFPVGVTWGFRDRDVLIEHGAKYLIDHPQELLTIIR